MAARQGRYAQASAYYEKTLARDPDRLDALVQLGIPGPCAPGGLVRRAASSATGSGRASGAAGRAPPTRHERRVLEFRPCDRV